MLVFILMKLQDKIATLLSIRISSLILFNNTAL